VLEIAVTDALRLENSVPRDRALISAAMAAAKLIQPGEREVLLSSLGQTVGYKRREDDDVCGFEDDPGSGEHPATSRGAPRAAS
jgi:hypothetical protein